MLRMFNDGLVMLLVYSAIALYMVPVGGAGKDARRGVERRWMMGTVLLRCVAVALQVSKDANCHFLHLLITFLAPRAHSCALSIKMSTLLFLPALFYLVFAHLSPLALLQHVVLLLVPLSLLSSPFLSTAAHAQTYLLQAFDFGRAFDWRYTLNWRFLGQEAFDNPRWGTVLLLAHGIGLSLWADKWAGQDAGGAVQLLRRAVRAPGRKPSPAALAPSRTYLPFPSAVPPSRAR